MGQKNYTFEKVLLGPQQGFAQAALGSLMRRAAGENLPLMKVTFRGDSVTYYADYSQHVVVYKLEMGESISVESENLLAFTQDCKYGVRFLGQGIMSQKGMATTELIGQGPNAYVAITTNGNPIVLSNYHTGNTITVDPDGTAGNLRSQHHNGFQLEDSDRSGIRRILFLRMVRQPEGHGRHSADGAQRRNTGRSRLIFSVKRGLSHSAEKVHKYS